MIEFMGAMAIGLILSVLALSGFRLYEREMPLRHSAGRLAAAFSTARALAISNTGTYSVQVDVKARNFWIDETNSFGEPIVPKVLAPEKLDDTVTLAGIYFGAQPAPQYGTVTRIRFYSDGSSEDARLYLILAGANAADPANFDTVRLYGPTGASRVFERQRLALPVK